VELPRGVSSGLDDPEDAKKPEFRSQNKAKPKAKARKQPGKAVIAKRVSMTSRVGQSPHHGLQDDVWGAEGGSSCSGETPMPFDLEADFSEPEVQRPVTRHVMVTGDADFCRDRKVLEIADPEGPVAEADSDILAFAVGESLQVAEERVIYFLENEAPIVRPDERANDWEADSDADREPEGAARGLSSPSLILEIEQRVEEYLRVATPDIEALFPRPVCDLTCRRGVSAEDTRRYLDEYGAEYLKVEQDEQEYRARREQGKVWRRERDEIRRELEAKTQQLQIWQEDLARRAEEAVERSEEERRAEEKRMKKVEREQLEEQKRHEDKQQLEEKRRKAEAKKKEEKERREVEKQKPEEEARRIRRKEVDTATALAKKEKED
jgi:hypothetical protein